MEYALFLLHLYLQEKKRQERQKVLANGQYMFSQSCIKYPREKIEKN